MPLYLSNTNRLESLQGNTLRGPFSGSPTPEPVITGSYFNGLGRQGYIGYINPFVNPNWPSTAVTTGSLVADSGSLVPVYVSGSSINTQWLGYFKASTTETYTFILFSDDQSILWVGNAATASVLTTGSALILEQTGVPVSSGSISLTSGSYYPIRLQFADGAGDVYFTSSFRTPTIPQTSDYTNYTFCSTSSLGF